MALTDLVLETEYRTGQVDLGRTFYRSCLDQSALYDRAVGYFSSTIFVVIGDAVVEFARRGGRIRLVCSPELTAADIEALEKGHARIDSLAAERVAEELEYLLADEACREHVRVLATLVALQIIEVKIAIRRDGRGIFHEKIGIFEDSKGNAVSFLGSANETWHAWDKLGNYEAIEVFCSWSPDVQRVAKHRAHFARIWDNRDAALAVLPFPEAARKRLCSVAQHSLADLPTKEGISNSIIPLREHQKAAIENWRVSGFRGVFKHATGSGKTITALSAMRPHLKDGGVVIILVPSQLLLVQWLGEIQGFFGDVSVLLAGAGHNDWRTPGTLRSFTSEDPLMGGRVVLATMQTARSMEFVGRTRGGAHVLLIADEVHQVGSTENSRALQINAGKRLGLSATPERYQDSAGTAHILNYFGPILQPEYSLADAITDGHLVNYEYHPGVVSLSDTETQDWRTLSDEIGKLVARSGGTSSLTPQAASRLDRLRVRRARIAKNASQKSETCQAILKREYRRGQRWIVYCESQDQLGQILSDTRLWCPEVLEYHSGMRGDRATTLAWFQDHGGILVAIACLDEGVNIPSVSHAIILASSQNPRQFIQRRGRILRAHKAKRMAFIYDVLVSPESVDEEPTQQSLLKSELRRALEFSKSAVNGSAAATLRIIALRAGIDPDSLDDIANDALADNDKTSDSEEATSNEQ